MFGTDRKRPWLAAFLAFLSPGLGHIYLREWLRAATWFGVLVGAMALLVPEAAFPAALTVDALVAAWLDAPEVIPLANRAVLFAVTSLSMADAYWVASRREAERDVGETCPVCGQELDPDLSFCHWCTTDLERE